MIAPTVGAVRTRGRLVGAVVTGLLIAWYVVAYTRTQTTTYRGYGYRTFDLAFYDQGVWLLSRFHAPYLSIVGRNLFGDHAQFLLIGLVPLYWLRPDPSTLFFAQALALGLGAVPVYLLARRRLASPLFATVLAAAFLLHPALGQSNLENFHPDAFLVPLLGFAIFAAVENRPRLFVVFCALALLGKEDAFLVVLPLACWYAWRQNRKVGAIVAAGSVAAALASMNLVMRPLVGVSTRNAYRIPFSACARACSLTRHVSDFAATLFAHPARVVRYLLSADSPNGRPFYVWQMLAPTGFAFLLAPEVGAVGVLVLAANVFSLESAQHQIAFHYSMVLLPVLAMGTVYAISRLRTRRAQSIAVAVVGACALLGAVWWGPDAFSRRHPTDTRASASEVRAIEQVRKQLPPNAVVVADDRFVTHVDHRRHVYLWPTPFYAQHWKLFEQEGTRLPESGTVQYLFLPVSITDHPDVFAQIRDQFVEVARAENAEGRGAVLYKRVES
jgi:uncharacterized membrane protein